MNKQPTIHHLAGGYSISSLPGSKSWARSQNSGRSLFDMFPKMLAFVFVAFFTLSFSSRFSSACTSIIIDEKKAAPSPLHARSTPREFSFEYSGLFHLKVVIKRAANAGILLFSDMDITTSTKP